MISVVCMHTLATALRSRICNNLKIITNCNCLKSRIAILTEKEKLSPLYVSLRSR
jgi:hypothetical protein